MIFNQIKGGGNARVSIINGGANNTVALEGLSIGAATYRVGLNEAGEGSAEVVPGGYRVYYAGTVNPPNNIVRLHTGPNVIDMGE